MKPEIKVVFIAACPFKYPRGTPIRIFRTAEAIASLGHEVHVITYHLGDPVNNSSIKVHRIKRIPFYNKLDPGPSWVKLFIVDFFLFLKAFQVIRKEKFDIIQAHHYEGLLTSFLPSRIYSIPIIYDAHTLLATELHHYKMFIGKRTLKFIGQLFDRYIPRGADRIITVSEEIRKGLIDSTKFDPSKIFAIPNGVDVNHFIVDVTPQNCKEDRQFILGYAGNFGKFQRLDLLFEAVEILKAQGEIFTLNLYSNSTPGDLLAMIKALKLENIVNFVHVTYDDLPYWLAQTDILLNPRVDGEGYPQKLLNYMAAGKPIVSFSGSARNLIHMENGWIVEGEDVHDFADAICILMKDEALREKLGKNARKYMQESYMWSTRAEAINDVYKDILRERG